LRNILFLRNQVLSNAISRTSSRYKYYTHQMQILVLALLSKYDSIILELNKTTIEFEEFLST
jgi:hypothetical protein